MTNNISGKDRDFGQLLDIVKQDTPDISNDELLSLITKSEERSSLPMRESNVQRSKRGVIAMSVSAILLILAYYIALSNSQDHSRPVQLAVQSTEKNNSHDQLTIDSQRAKARSTLDQTESITGDEDANRPKRSSISEMDRWKTFVQKPIDLSGFEVIEISPDQYASLGIQPSSDDEYIYYHNQTKVGFPRRDYLHGFDDEDRDPLVPILGNRPYYAEYGTDSRGNMMMHYTTRRVGGGNSMSLGFFDRDLENLKGLDYFGLENIMTFPTADSVKDFRKLVLVVKKGIVKIDTVLTGKYADAKLIEGRQEEIITRARRMDTAIKMGYGGMREIAKKFPFEFADSANPLVSRVVKRFAKISPKGKSDLEIVSAKMTAVNDMIYTEPITADKLRLEQLFIKLSYEAYVEQGKLEAAALENPVDLIPVRVRNVTGRKVNPLFDDGLILWYRDSDTLRKVLGKAMSSVRLNADPKLKLSVMPNPAMLYLYANYELDEAGPLRLTLADITGKQVYTDVWKAQAGSGKREINVQQIAAGIYMLILDSEHGRTTKQVIIQHQ
jgi:hypothetical protein